jgi:hypothetical protein
MNLKTALKKCATQRLSGRAHFILIAARYAAVTDPGIVPKRVATTFQVHGGIMTIVRFAAETANIIAAKKRAI